MRAASFFQATLAHVRLDPLVIGVLLLGGASVGAGCGAGQEPPSARASLRETAASLRAPDPQVERPIATAERAALADALEQAPLERRAIASLPSADGQARAVVLVEEGGTLRVEAGVLGVPALDTPERAIAALHRALVRELSLGPGLLLVESERRPWLEERARYRDGTASPEALEVRREADRAVAITPLGDEIVLEREGLEWRVVSMRAQGID